MAATVVLKVGSNTSYGDGDVLCCFTQRRVHAVHAENICHVQTAQRNSDGLIVSNSVTVDWMQNARTFKFERISQTQIRRTNLITSAQDILSNTKNQNGERIHVQQFIDRRKQLGAQCPLFGTAGAEFWYGGGVDLSQAKVTAIWNAIETKTPKRLADHSLWPAGQRDLRSHLFLHANDLSEALAELVVESEWDQTDPQRPVMLRKRKRFVPWRSFAALISRITEIDNKTRIVDLREIVSKFTLSNVIQVKV